MWPRRDLRHRYKDGDEYLFFRGTRRRVCTAQHRSTVIAMALWPSRVEAALASARASSISVADPEGRAQLTASLGRATPLHANAGVTV